MSGRKLYSKSGRRTKRMRPAIDENGNIISQEEKEKKMKMDEEDGLPPLKDDMEAEFDTEEVLEAFTKETAEASGIPEEILNGTKSRPKSGSEIEFERLPEVDTRLTCSKILANGNRCKNFPNEDSEFCWLHTPKENEDEGISEEDTTAENQEDN